MRVPFAIEPANVFVVTNSMEPESQCKRLKVSCADNVGRRATPAACIDYLPSQRLLFVGEGNFTFTRALLRRWKRNPESASELPVNFTCTSYETRAELDQLYTTLVADAVAELEAAGGRLTTPTAPGP